MAAQDIKSARKFIIQKHSKADEVHWDLMLEAGAVLKTYRLGLPPEKLLQKKTTAAKIFDHPLKFLSYEGSVNQGLGSVVIVEVGTYHIVSERRDRCVLQLEGKVLKGKFTLTYIKGNRWEFSSS